MADLMDTGDGVDVAGRDYRWSWRRAGDEVVVSDGWGRTIVAHHLQPLVETTSPPRGGTCDGYSLHGDGLTVVYRGVNGGARLKVHLRFRDDHLALESVAYDTPRSEDVVALHYTADAGSGVIVPNARAERCFLPGACQSPERYLFEPSELDGKKLSLGVCGTATGDFHQQWALPAHFMACGGSAGGAGWACWGLAALPDGHLMVRSGGECFSLYVNLRSDLWGHRRGPGRIEFAWPWLTAFGDGWYGAVVSYLEALAGGRYVAAGGRPPPSSGWPQFNTWGDQAFRRCMAANFDGGHLRRIYRDFRASGLAARLFVVDDKWESLYGAFRHDGERFPDFEGFLDEVRGDGLETGLWTALPRCEDFPALGLDETCVLRGPDGTPYQHREPGEHGRRWYFFDPTVARTAAYLRERAFEMVRRYRPKLVKLDFGYELPTSDAACPHDPSSAGERLFDRLLEVFGGALKEADPGITLQYYCLSPLVAARLDQCSLDDLWLSRGDYHAGFRRRALLSIWCGRMGVVPYGSTGYDWRSAPDIWFDSAVIGTPGCIAPLAGDEYGQEPSPRDVARFNGACRAARPPAAYSVDLAGADMDDPQGPRPLSWARIEGGQPVVVALRPAPGGAASYGDLLETDCQVLVASLTARGIGAGRRLAVVPFRSGRLRLAWPEGRAAPRVRLHLLGGRWTAGAATRAGGYLEVPLSEVAADGTPVEYVEVAW